MTKSAAHATAAAALRTYALAYPEATEDTPWGHSAIKVRGKSFVFLHSDEKEFSVSTKLPESAHAALMLPFAEPTGYGLAKSSWVTARFDPTEPPPLAILREWVDESYRAIAPKKLVATLPSLRSSAEEHAKSP